MKEYTTQDALKKAEEYCKTNPNWELICNIKESNTLSLSFDELSSSEQAKWRKAYPIMTKLAWEELGNAPSRHPFKYVSGAGGVFDNVLDVPHGHQLMMIFDLSRAKSGGYAY
tara:strand:- start:113 stop:451 length:339 start_codon:yes stop_codon:yes gene_type:complete